MKVRDRGTIHESTTSLATWNIRTNAEMMLKLEDTRFKREIKFVCREHIRNVENLGSMV